MGKPPKKGDKFERGEIVEFPVVAGSEEAKKAIEEFRSAFQKFGAEISANPNADGWSRLCEILDEASKDSRVISSPGASDFLDLMRGLAADAITAPSADRAIQPLVAVIKSSHSSDLAIKRFAGERKARGWVISEWTKYKSDYGGNKSEFARHYAKRVFNEFDVDVKERNIKDRWLKGL